MASHAQIVDRWIDVVNGAKDRRGNALENFSRRTSNVFGENHPARYGSGASDVIYSYGYHFPMAEVYRTNAGVPRLVLLNGDTYSSSTSGHQSHVRGAVRKIMAPSVIIPFSALHGAGIDHASIEVLAQRPDRNVETRHARTEKPSERHALMDDPSGATRTVERWHWDTELSRHVNGPVEEPVQVADPNRVYVGQSSWLIAELYEPTGEWRWTTSRHFLGDAVIRAKANGRWAKYLSSFDYQEATPLYFLCELPRGANVETVDAAVESLKPREVVEAESMALEVTRQGDLFAIPTELSTREVKALTPYGQGRVVKRAYMLETNHTATEVVFATGGRTYARGTMYHEPRGWRDADHARRRMGDGKTWHLMVRNTVPRARERNLTNTSIR